MTAAYRRPNAVQSIMRSIYVAFSKNYRRVAHIATQKGTKLLPQRHAHMQIGRVRCCEVELNRVVSKLRFIATQNTTSPTRPKKWDEA